MHKIFQQGDKDDPKTQALKAKAIALLKNREVLLSEHAIEAGELLDELVGRHWVQDYIEDSYRN
ncbi:MAG TPA: hypothetical protein DF383_03825 [Deltaproteobacteria bacterium]|nr:hypothetical protein [Deltaproteobacteria bacterium]